MGQPGEPLPMLMLVFFAVSVLMPCLCFSYGHRHTIVEREGQEGRREGREEEGERKAYVFAYAYAFSFADLCLWR